MFINDYEQDILQREAAHDTHRPNLGMAVLTLCRLADWTNANSDGWAYWPKPSRAAKSLSDVLYTYYLGRHDQRPEGDITKAQLNRLLAPVRAFCTRMLPTHPSIREEVFPNG